ncbi:hypothetical protein M0R45_035511 [Rubus argutus]|uniref:Uncharacterized protein n=1 Tax=Rubus argutus TaxID=59490 RepID=A0AAW1VV48_RUBAR
MSQLTYSAALPTPTSPSDELITAGVSIYHDDPSPLPCNSPQPDTELINPNFHDFHFVFPSSKAKALGFAVLIETSLI